MRKLSAAVIAAVLACGLQACAGGTGSPHRVLAHGKPSAGHLSGIETFTGAIAGNAARTAAPVFPLAFAGPADATSATAASGTDIPDAYRTSAGILRIRHTTATGPGSSTRQIVDPAACRVEYRTHVVYSVAGAESSGVFRDAKGHGTIEMVFMADVPKISGHCEPGTGRPAGTAPAAMFTATGPITIRH